jgi:hypothetical protein
MFVSQADFENDCTLGFVDNVLECTGGTTTLYSVGFRLGLKPRQTLRMVDESEMEAYISHLRNVSAAREYDGGRLVEVIARLRGLYVLHLIAKPVRVSTFIDYLNLFHPNLYGGKLQNINIPKFHCFT